MKPDDGQVVVCAFGLAAIARSSDFGSSWRKVGENEEGEPGYVYWSRQDTRLVYAANQRSMDAGETWRPMDRYVLAMSAANGNVVAGTRFLGVSRVGRKEDPMTAPAVLSVSLDGGGTWVDLPPLPQERMPGDGGLYNVSVLDYVSHGVAIDPGHEHDPAAGPEARLRLLVAGRSGVYEYRAADPGGSGGRWRVFNKGFEANPYHRVHEPVPWLGDVVFDPRPGHHNVVYAAQTIDRITETTRMRDWEGVRNANRIPPGGQTRRPLYRSDDGGRTWRSLHGGEFSGIPDHLTVTAIEVGPSGTLFADGFMGLYSLASDAKDAARVTRRH